ncbi:hypothetical protein KCU85_g411, partial [Aureobasidium melanogenum]
LDRCVEEQADVLVVGLLHKVRCDFAKVGRLDELKEWKERVAKVTKLLNRCQAGTFTCSFLPHTFIPWSKRYFLQNILVCVFRDAMLRFDDDYRPSHEASFPTPTSQIPEIQHTSPISLEYRRAAVGPRFELTLLELFPTLRIFHLQLLQLFHVGSKLLQYSFPSSLMHQNSKLWSRHRRPVRFHRRWRLKVDPRPDVQQDGPTHPALVLVWHPQHRAAWTAWQYATICFANALTTSLWPGPGTYIGLVSAEAGHKDNIVTYIDINADKSALITDKRAMQSLQVVQLGGSFARSLEWAGVP